VDNVSGTQIKNGSWTGVLGMILRGEVEVGDMPLVMTPSRTSIVDFTFPLTDIKHVPLFMKLLKLFIFLQ
jgi:hypothetical protein